MDPEDKFDPAKFDPAQVPPDWTPPELDVDAKPPEHIGPGDHVTKPVTHAGAGSAWWVTALIAMAFIARTVRSLHLRF